MERRIRREEYKEHELSVTCVRDWHGWVIDRLSVKRGCATMFPSIEEPFHFYRSAKAAESAGLDDARHYVDDVWAGRAGNA